MNSRRQTTAFYIETVLLMISFMMIIMVLMRVFTAARLQSILAEQLTDAVILAENAEEAFLGSESVEDLGDVLHGEVIDDVVRVEDEAYVVEVLWQEEQREYGSLIRASISVMNEDELIYELDTGKYVKEAAE